MTIATQTKNWQELELKDVAEIIDGDRGKNYPKNNEFFDEGYCLFLNTKNVPSNRFSFTEKMFITEEKDRLLRKGRLTRGDYVLTTRGTIGNFAHYTKDNPYQCMRINSGMVILRAKSIDENYFGFYLDSPQFRDQVLSRVSGSAQPQLPIKDLETFNIFLPPDATQKQIADVLSAYDDLIENNTKRIKILEQVAQAIYREWFVYFRFPGHEKVKMIDSGTDFGKIPEKWKVGQLREIGELVKQPYTNGDDNLPLVDMSRMQSGTLAINEVGKSSDLSTSRIIFSKDDLLFGSIRTYLYKVALAPFAGITNTSVFVIRPRAVHFKAILAISVFRKEAIDWTNQYSTGTKMPVIKWEAMRGMPIIIPSSPILENFQNSVWPMLEKIQDFYYINAKLRRVRDLLLLKLVSGEIGVK